MMDTLREVNNVFRHIANDNKLRLKHGLVRREKMWAAVKAGKIPSRDYRYKWVIGSAEEMIYRLGVIAGQFDTAHAGDMASLEDFKDILRMAIKLLEEREKKK